MDDIGVARVRNDGLEEAEARLNMFKMPHRLPVGRERERMHPQEFYRRAGPAVADARQQERDVMDIIEKSAQNPHGGARMASVAFNQQPRSHVQRNMFGYHAEDDHGVARHTSVTGHEHKDTESHQVAGIFNDDAATRLVDGSGGGAGGYHKGAQLADGVGVHQHLRGGDPAGRGRRGPHGQQQQQQQPKLIPSSAMLGCDVRGTWVVDRDQRNLELATNPAALARAAEDAESNHRMCEHNRVHSRRSNIKFGDFELNPGGHRLNEDAQRADDYGVARLRSDVVFRPPGQQGQVAALLHDPDPHQPSQGPHAHNKFAGKSQKSNLSFGTDGAVEPVHRGPFAGRRAKSVVFDDGAGPAQNPAPERDGYYLGLDAMGGPGVKHNPYAGKITESGAMEHRIKYDPAGHADETRMAHERRRAQMPTHARKMPIVEEVVFDNHPLNRNAQGFSDGVPTRYVAEVQGKRSVHGGQMPPEALRAAHTAVGPRELGGSATEDHPDEPIKPAGPKGGYADHQDLLHYNEFDRARLPAAPPPAVPSVVAEAINGGQVAPNAYSPEPRGLPKRHPGPERLKRGRGVDGRGHDHQGRQLATSLVDEVIFGRQNFQGKIPLANNGANFTIDKAGEFAHR